MRSQSLQIPVVEVADSLWYGDNSLKNIGLENTLGQLGGLSKIYVHVVCENS